ncbi:transposase, partial [Paludibaculum fermentans]|uniref:transposase n=1 Tax=Paludibaculum fermentans TaxID=1473598 RepID=UPI003EC11B51
MPRSARFIAPGVAHHITQRGIDRQSVFHSRRDRLTYLSLLREQAAVSNLPILAYCLMANHIHLIAVPHEAPVRAACGGSRAAAFAPPPVPEGQLKCIFEAAPKRVAFFWEEG